MSTLWIPLFPFALFFAWLFLFTGGKTCPDCRKPLPRLQSPFTKTRRQWMEGGSVCRNCGCETDLAGAKVPRGTSPRPRRLLVGVVLPALALTAFVLMLATINRP